MQSILTPSSDPNAFSVRSLSCYFVNLWSVVPLTCATALYKLLASHDYFISRMNYESVCSFSFLCKSTGSNMHMRYFICPLSRAVCSMAGEMSGGTSPEGCEAILLSLNYLGWSPGSVPVGTLMIDKVLSSTHHWPMHISYLNKMFERLVSCSSMVFKCIRFVCVCVCERTPHQEKMSHQQTIVKC